MERVRITNSTIIFAAFIIVLLMIAFYAKYIVLLSLIALGLGTLFTPILNFLRSKFHLPRGLSALIVMLGIILIVGIVGGSIYYLVADQMTELAKSSPEILKKIQLWGSDMFDRFPWLKSQIQQFKIGGTAKQSLISLLNGLRMSLIALSVALLILVMGLFTAVNGGEYFKSLLQAFPPQYRDKARSVLMECARVLRGWFNAQLIDMLIIGCLTSLGLWITGIQYWAVFGLLTAVLGIIPYIGIIIVVFMATLITLVSDPGKVPFVLLVFIITQQLESDVILPLVMKGRAELPVVPLLIFMLFLGSFFGILGIFVAPALFAVLRTIYLKIYLPYINGELRSSPDHNASLS
jgi:predicted PurR-regulated permease PerM